MSTGARRPAAAARGLADQLLAQLAPYTTRIEVAGSLRRGAAEVGDIEICAIPTVDRQPAGLFGDEWSEVNLLDAECGRLREAGVLAPRLDVNGLPRWGAKHKAALFEGMAVDLFSIVPGSDAQWGVIFLIRTGPAAWSKQLVTPRRQGGWMPEYLVCRDGALRYRETGEVLPTPEETDVFAALKRAYIPPERRG